MQTECGSVHFLSYKEVLWSLKMVVFEVIWGSGEAACEDGFISKMPL
jgi:hypothetical protein